MKPQVRCRSTERGVRGFTLIELMIGLAVLVILAALALPSLQDAIRKNRRAEAFAALSTVQQSQERWRSNRAAYASNLANTAPVGDPPNGLGLPSTTSGGYYTLQIDAANGTSYSVTATAASGTSQAADGACARLRVRMAGGNVFYGSAAIGAGSFDESSANRCWSR